MTKESLTNEITELGMSLIMGGTTDAFGAAKQELLALLNWADDCADYIDQNISIS